MSKIGIFWPFFGSVIIQLLGFLQSCELLAMFAEIKFNEGCRKWTLEYYITNITMMFFTIVVFLVHAQWVRQQRGKL